MNTTMGKIATDVVTVGVAVTAVLQLVIQMAPAIHISPSAQAIIITASSALATVIAVARRFAVQKAAAKKAAK
jgi:preprotein translocase subunit Sec61beta